MGDFEAVALPSVRHAALAQALLSLGTTWADAAHVTATRTLAGAIREKGAVALPLATLTDMLVMPALPGDLAHGLDEFPPPPRAAATRTTAHPSGTPSGWDTKVSQWQDESTGRRMRIAIQVDDALRGFVRSEGAGPTGQALLASRRAFSTTMYTLAAAGVDPRELRPESPVGRLAARAWTYAEEQVPAMSVHRHLLWTDLVDFTSQSDEWSRKVAGGLRSALAAAFGPLDAPRTIVHHGFYFYTPPQWAMFQLLRRLPEVNQVFLVHDDGENPAFASWRHYFHSGLSMPNPSRHETLDEPITKPATALRSALRGQPVHPNDLAEVKVLECRSPTDLARLWRIESLRATEDPQGARAPRRFAASADEVERFVRRLGGGTERTAPQLAQLPVGAFLLALHRCISVGPHGEPEVLITRESLLAIVESGYLDLPDDDIRVDAATLRRALDFFSDCTTGTQWRSRARDLEALLSDRPDLVDATTAGSTASPTAPQNYLRLVPWTELPPSAARGIRAAIDRTVGLVGEIASRERVVLADHVRLVSRRLANAMSGLSDADQKIVKNKIAGFSAGLGDEIDVIGLVDVVAMLLGRTAKFESFDSESDQSHERRQVEHLRGLDQLGLARTDRPLHLANLAEGTLPSAPATVGWPFSLADLVAAPDAVDPVTVDLLQTRSKTAALGDLYLFWLALDGVAPGTPLTLSWISDLEGERRRVSPLVGLLTQLGTSDSTYGAVAGGLPLEPADNLSSVSDGLTNGVEPREPEPSAATLRAGAGRLNRTAAASSHACPRRFALQWALGPSAGFAPSYQQTMLYGNLLNALVRDKTDNPFIRTAAVQTVDSLWPHLTPGEKASSQNKAPVKQQGWTADPAWIYTLAGKKDGRGALDRAYEAARKQAPADPAVVVPPESRYLPPGVGDAKVCRACPVQARCSEFTPSET